MASLVELNILPEECARKGGNVIAPGLVQRRRRVIRESLKDGLRVWVERRAVLVRRRKEEAEGEKERLGVKELIKTFTRRVLEEQEPLPEERRAGGRIAGQRKKAPPRWGREDDVARKWEDRRRGPAGVQGGDGGCSQPTRAHVLGLKRFWEGVIKAAAG